MRQTVVDSELVARCLTSDDDLRNVLCAPGPVRVQTVNLHHVALARGDSPAAETLHDADWITADGWPVVWAVRGHGRDVMRVTGSELVRRILIDDALLALRIGLLGADESVADRWAAGLGAAGGTVSFREHGRLRDWDPAEIALRCNESQTDLLLVAVTPPAGDEIARRIHDAGFGGNIVGVGGAIDMATGHRRPAPPLVRRLGVEWAYRMAQEPRRLAHRYLVECMPTMLTEILVPVLRHSLVHR